MENEYVVTGQMHANRYDPDAGQITRGWWITFRDLKTRVVDQVFVPDGYYPDRVAEFILSSMADTRLVHVLGAGPDAITR